MTDQQRGYGGWPAPVEPARQAGAPSGSAPGAMPDEDPPWFEDVPWDHPTEGAWPEPEPDFGQWYDQAPVGEAAADDGADDKPEPAAHTEAADADVVAPVLAAEPTHGAPFLAPTSPAYPAPSPAPYAAPDVPPYAAPTYPRQPTTTMPYAAAGTPVYAPSQPIPPAGNGRPTSELPLRFGNRFGSAQPVSPEPRPVAPLPAWDEEAFAPPPTFPSSPVREAAAQPAYEATATPDVAFAPPAQPANGFGDDDHGVPPEFGDPYDEFAPLADDLVPAAARSEPDQVEQADSPAMPEPSPAESDPTPPMAAPASQWSSPRPATASVFGDLFAAAPSAMPRRDAQPVAPSLSAPSAPKPMPTEPDSFEFAAPEPAAESAEPAAEAAEPAPSAEPEDDFAFAATEPAAETADSAASPEAEPQPEPEPEDELALGNGDSPNEATVPEPTPDWPRVPMSFAPKPWESVSRPATPWGGWRTTDRPMRPDSRAATPTPTSPAVAAEAEVPPTPPLARVAPSEAIPVAPATPIARASTSPTPVPGLWAQPPATQAMPAASTVSKPVPSFRPPFVPSAQPAGQPPVPQAMPQTRAVPPARFQPPEGQPGAVLARHLAATSAPASVPAAAVPTPFAPVGPMAAATAPAASPAPLNNPTRAALAEHGTPDELWFLAPQTQGHPAASGTESDAEDEPSTMSTLFWTVMTGVLVVALVLAFLHFLTGVFR
jgi:hypothetical protein